MKHYTETIPVVLAEKLKDKGMPIMLCLNITQMNSFSDDGGVHFYYRPTYAEAFDWLMEEKELYVSIIPTWDSPSDGHLNYEYQITALNVPFKEFKDNVSYSWRGAANAVIKKCLELM